MPYFQTPDHGQIYYQVDGDVGEPLVLLHGLASATPIWDPQIEALKKNYRIYRFDYPGHGQSQWLKRYTIEGFTSVLKYFIEYLQLPKVHLLGLSLGCDVGLLFAAKYPHRVQSLILEGPPGGIHSAFSPRAWEKYLKILVYLCLMFCLWKLIGMDRLVDWINRRDIQTFHYHELLYHVERQVDPAAVRDLTLENAYPPYLPFLNQITTPTLIIRGVSDLFPRRYAQFIQDNLGGPCEFCEISDARHVVSLEKPQVFNEAVLSFLKRHLIEVSSSHH